MKQTQDIALGEEINAVCQRMKAPMDSEWKPRALEEVTTAGYRPVKKHGVAINITPWAEKKIVPKAGGGEGDISLKHVLITI